MLRLALFCLLLAPLVAQAEPAKPASQPVPVTPVIRPPADERTEMLKKLVEAGVLMLEGKAYRQFIQAFVSDEDRRGFERAFGKSGYVDYNVWGRDKGAQMLKVLKLISAMEPVVRDDRACYSVPDSPRGKFSFVFVKDSWFIENKSGCPQDPPKKPEIIPPATPPAK